MDMGTCLPLPPNPSALNNEVCLAKNIPEPLTTVSSSMMGKGEGAKMRTGDKYETLSVYLEFLCGTWDTLRNVRG